MSPLNRQQNGTDNLGDKGQFKVSHLFGDRMLFFVEPIIIHFWQEVKMDDYLSNTKLRAACLVFVVQRSTY